MKITPLEIRQKTFEKNFRGYDKDEVHAFLLTLSQEWERVLDEVRELRLKLESAEKEVARMREVENSLFKTLKTAEDTGTSLIEQSRQQAELLMREARLKADTLLSEARAQARSITDAAELRSRQLLAELDVRLKALAENYKKMQSLRENLLMELRHTAQETMERAERLRSAVPDFDADAHIHKISMAETFVSPKEPQPESPEPAGTSAHPETTTNSAATHIHDERLPDEQQAKHSVMASFFDEIG
jgi:cell division initiation protein